MIEQFNWTHSYEVAVGVSTGMLALSLLYELRDLVAKLKKRREKQEMLRRLRQMKASR